MSGYAGSGFAFDYLTASSTSPTSPCSLPPLPEGRYAHASAFLPGGKLVICGGRDFNKTVLDSCLSWQPGNSTWHYFYTMRYVTAKDRNDFNCIHRVPRRYPDIWSPTSKPDIFFLIGAFGDGYDQATITAEAIPSKHFLPRWKTHVF